MIKLTVLHNEYETFVEEKAGFSVLIELQEEKLKILFDTSMKDDIVVNAKKSNIDLLNIDYVVFSHGHYDHTDGIKYLKLSEIRHIIAHPDCFTKKFAKYKGKEVYIGIPFFLEYLQRETDVIQSKIPYWISEKVVFLGEIPRTNNFEGRESLGYLENHEHDLILDDSALVIKGNDGIIIISGCSHSGICNIIEYAKEVCNENKIAVVMGGFHLFDKKRISPTIDYLQSQKIDKLFVAHCLSDFAFAQMEKAGAKRIQTLEEFYF